MQKLLFLDDESYRHTAPYDHAFDTTHAYDLAQFIGALYHFGPFDYFSLDHDLGSDHYAGKHGFCGCDAAKIITMLPTKPKLVVVHSFNNVAAQSMVRIFQDHGIEAIWKPFHPKNTMSKQLDSAVLVK